MKHFRLIGAFLISAISTIAAAQVYNPEGPPRQATVASPAGGTITVTLLGGGAYCELDGVSILPASSVGAPPSNQRFLHGYLQIRARYCDAGASLPLRIQLPGPALGMSFWSYAGQWRQSTTGVSGSVLNFSIMDGGPGDEDTYANGSVVIKGGVALPGAVASYTDLWWAGPSENGWGMSIVQHGDILFSVVYAYDNAGRAEWYVMPGGSWNAARTTYTGPIYTPSGSPYHAYNVSSLVVGDPVGTMAITFTASDSATLDFTVRGVAGRKTIVRQLFADVSVTLPTSYSDMWWAGSAQNGWGIAVIQQEVTLFIVWFTYDDQGRATWFVMPGGVWTDTTLTTYEGRIYRTAGSPWAAYVASQLQAVDAGSYRLRFKADGSATFEYSLDGRTGTLPLQRQPF